MGQRVFYQGFYGLLGGGLLVFALGCSQKKENLNDQVQPTARNGAALTGRLSIDSSCPIRTATVYLASNGQVSTEISVNDQGTYEFQMTPGTYAIGAVAGDCFDDESFTVTEGRVLAINLTPRLSTNSSSNTQGSNNSRYRDIPKSPCIWGYYGCFPIYYSGYGDAIVGKPNVYISGPQQMKFSLKIQAKGISNMIAATPLHGKAGWRGQIEGKSIKVDRAKHEYLFYDLRFSSQKLQEGKGVCVGRESLVPTMAQYLAELGFREDEIKDFRDHWGVRVPPATRYCIYPQENADIESIAEYEVEPRPDSVVRVWFFVVPDGVEAKRIPPTPTVARWFRKPRSRSVATRKTLKPLKRKISSLGEIRFEIREWGVGFLLQ